MAVPIFNERNDTLNNDKPIILSTSKLFNTEVRNSNNHKLGNLKKMMMDTVSGKIMYGIIAYGGVWGIGEKLAAVPWSSMTFNKKTPHFFLDIVLEDLTSAPSFENDSWPNMNDTQWVNQVDEFYGKSVKQRPITS